MNPIMPEALSAQKHTAQSICSHARAAPNGGHCAPSTPERMRQLAPKDPGPRYEPVQPRRPRAPRRDDRNDPLIAHTIPGTKTITRQTRRGKTATDTATTSLLTALTPRPAE